MPVITWFALFVSLIGTQSAEDQVRAAVIAFNEAYADNDLATYFGYYADDATLWFDTDRVTLEEYKKDWHELVEGGGGVETNRLSDIRVRVSPGGDVAIATYSLEVVTRYPDGRRTNERSAETDVWFRRDGGWTIAHIHYDAEPAPSQ